MATQAFTVDKPESGANEAVDLPESDASSLSFGTSEIQGMQLSEGGELTISFTDGSALTINNFRALADNEVQLSLEDGSAINSRELFETLAADFPARSISQPDADQSIAYNIESGRKYEFDFGEAKPVEVSEQDGALLITFDNNGLLVLHGFQDAVGSEMATEASVDGQFLTLREFADGMEMAAAMNDGIIEDQQGGDEGQKTATMEDTRQSGEDELAQLAQQLSEIEPAAGENGGAAGGRGGYGFNSNYETTPLNSPDDVGPIGETELLYGLPEFKDEVFPDEAQSSNGFTLRPPTVTANGGVDDAQVKEDGSVYVPITAAVGVDSPSTTILTVTVTGIDPAWGVGFIDGSYDAGTGTWTITLPAGTIDYSGGLTFTPPAESDVDLTGLIAKAEAFDPVSGQSAEDTDGFNIIVDAVADDPSITATGGTDVEGTSIAVDIKGMLGTDDFDGSESITHYEVTGATGYSFNQGTQISPDVWQFTEAELVGLTIKANDPTFDGTITLTAEVFTTENPVSDGEFDFADNDNSAITEFVVTWTPTINPPTIKVNGGVDDAQVKEDSSVDVLVEAKLDPNAEPAEYLTITITGFDPAWGAYVNADGFGSFNGANTVWTYTAPAGTDVTTTFTFTPNAESDIDLTGLQATVTATDPIEGISADGTPDDFNVIVDAVADDPSITAAGDTDVEGSVLDVDIQGFLGTDLDGSESIDYYTISGVPAEVTFSAGTNNGGGVWQFTPAQIIGLQATHADGDFDGTISLTATVYTKEGAVLGAGEYDDTDNTNQASDAFDLVWTPEIDPPTIKVNGGIDDVQVKEDNTVDVTVVAQRAAGAEPAEYLTVTITGFDPSWGAVVNNDGVGAFINGGTEWTVTLAAGEDLNTSFNFAPAVESDIDLTGLTATVTATDPVEGLSASANDDFNVIVDAVADDPSITATGDTDVEGSVLDVDIAGMLGSDMDGSEMITGYQISGTPSEVTFNNGTYDAVNDVWNFTPAELVGLQATHSNSNFNGTLNLTATVFTTENPVSDGEYDLSDNNNSASDGFSLTWTPEIDPPTIKVNGGIDDAQVKEDNSVDVSVVANLAPGHDTDEYLIVKITGFDPAWGAVTNNDGIGSFINGGTEWEITLPAGASLDTSFNFAPAAESDIDLTGLVATATAIDPSEDIFASANDGFNVIVDAVADDPTLDASSVAKEEGQPIDITLDGQLGSDLDGSEMITGYQISGVPAGFSFNQGTDEGAGVWSFTPAQISGLQILSTDPTFAGTLNLTATVFTTENPVSDGEYDLSDNNNSASDALKVTWLDDDEPEVKDAANTVDETDLGTAAATVSGTLQADFGDDAPGTYSFTGWSSTVALTSNNVPVTVSPTASGFVGTVGTDTIFTLTLNATTGAYDFELTGVLDHPLTGLNGVNHNDGFDIIFDFAATDSDSDTNPGTLTITVLDDGLEAHNDYNLFNEDDGSASGNVITGLNGGAGAADDLSNDTPNTVTKVSFKGTEVDLVGGTAQIDGDFGKLTINSDGSYTYELFGGVGGSGTPTQHTFAGGPGVFPDMDESDALDASEQQAIGVAPGDLDVAAGDVMSFTYVGEKAGYSNTVGVFTVANDGTIVAGQVLIGDTDATTPGTTFDYTVAANSASAGFFIIADGADHNSGIDFSTGSIEFIFGYGTAGERAATINDNSSDISIVYNGTTVLSGPVYYSNERGAGNMNPDGQSHIVSDLADESDNTVLRVGFEDLPHLGDADFNDAIFDVSIVSPAEPCDCGVDEFVYTLTDGDDDTSTATLTLECFEDDTPILAKIDTKTVDETDMSPEASVSGAVTADFGDDGPGSFHVNDTFFSSVPLKSNGVDVVVQQYGNAYVGFAGGEHIFSLNMHANGYYDFVLKGTLDHPVPTDTSADPDHDSDVIELQFGIRASDSDDDYADGFITIKVLDDGLKANDDLNQYDSSVGTTDGNVITGENGGIGATDDLSNDEPNAVTFIKFGSETKAVTDAGVTIDGDHGQLFIKADGSYAYTQNPSSGGTPGGSFALNPTSGDVSGTQESITKDGITVSVKNSGNFDIKWVNTSDGAGLGIDNLNSGDSTKVWPKGETFAIGFAENVDTVTLTIAELGSNNNYGDHGLDYTIKLADGTTVVGEQQFVPSEIVNGHFTFTIDSSVYGQLIDSIDINSTNDGAYNGASFLLNNVTATTPGTPDDCACETDEFVYTIMDADGDTSTATLTLECVDPKLLVGENVNDVNGSSTTFHVGDEAGIITGGLASDILIGDVGGSSLQNVDKDYNVVLMLDVSGSMGNPDNSGSRLYKLINAVENLLGDLNAYNGGDVKVHIVPFSTDAHAAGTFTVTDASGLANAISFLGSMPNDGWTNYEAALQSAIEWLESSDPINGAETISYFISDGEPNYYLDNNGNVVSNNNSGVSMDQIDGDADGTDEIAQLQALSDEVVGVGIEISGTTLGRIGQIDSDGNPINVENADDLSTALQGASPLNKLASVGGDDIVGGEGGDIIFGDAVNTDVLADAKGLSTQDGAGWEVFDVLEAGSGWDRDDTIAYIQNNLEELGAESVNAQNETRQGGDDMINGGAGDDTIFGQEGDDMISGGLGSDTLYGGSGEDTFLFESIADSAVDTIKDFDGSEDTIDLSQLLSGTSATQATIDQFVFADEVGGNTDLYVDLSGSGNIANGTKFAVLEGVTGFDVDQISADGNPIT